MTKSGTPGPIEILRAYKATKYADEVRGNWAIVLLYRVPGAFVAALALRLNLPAWCVTASSAVLSLLLPLIALLAPLGGAVWSVWILGMLVQILDCADGDVARNNGSASQRGGQLDFLADMAHWGMLYTAIGILADRHLGVIGPLTALALLAAWGRLYVRLMNDSVRKPPSPIPSLPASPIVHLTAFVSGLSGLIAFLALATPLGFLPVCALLVYSLLDLGDAALRVWRHPPA